MDLYTEAHLFVAAIRLLSHRHARPPALEEVCAELNFSVELGHTIRRRLEKKGIITCYEDPFSIKLGLENHLNIEELPREEPEENSLARELEKFQEKKKAGDKKLATIQAEMDRKKKDLFADLEARFRQELGKQKEEN